MGLIDLCGQTFGQLEVVCISDKRHQNGERLWVCECSCGKIIHARGSALRSDEKTCCPDCSIDKRFAPAREKAAEAARIKAEKLAEKARRKEAERAEAAERARLREEKQAERERLKEAAQAEAAEKARLREERLKLRQEKQAHRQTNKPKIQYAAKEDCRAYAGDRCAGLKEMMCRTRGQCKFYKSVIEKDSSE